MNQQRKTSTTSKPGRVGLGEQQEAGWKKELGERDCSREHGQNHGQGGKDQASFPYALQSPTGTSQRLSHMEAREQVSPRGRFQKGQSSR